MTMLSFRVAEADAAEAQRWAELLGIDRSALLREALHSRLAALRRESDAATWERIPSTAGESALTEIADWGPAEDWTEWRDASR